MNILCSLTNCVSVFTSPVPLPALLPALITVLMAVVVSVPVLASVFSFSSSSSSSSSSSHKSSVVGLQSDSLPSLFQPLPPPSLSAFSAAHRALQAAYRMQRQEKCKQN